MGALSKGVVVIEITDRGGSSVPAIQSTEPGQSNPTVANSKTVTNVLTVFFLWRSADLPSKIQPKVVQWSLIEWIGCSVTPVLPPRQPNSTGNGDYGLPLEGFRG